MNEKNAKWFWLSCALLFTCSMSWAQVQNPMEIALRYIEQQRSTLGLTEADIANYVISDNYSSKNNGVTHIYLLQQYEGIDVFAAMININILPDGRVLNIGNKFVPDLDSKVNALAPTISPEAAVQAVMNRFRTASTDGPLERLQEGNEREVVFDNEGVALEPIRVKLVYQPMPDHSVKLAWNVKFYELGGQNWWNVRVDAQTGEVLHYFNQIIHCEFGKPERNANETPLPKKENHNLPKLRTPNLQVQAAYNVYPIPLESPNHGDRELVIDPADPIASPFGWHDTNGLPGPEFTITRGNNAWAYQDIFDQNNSYNDEPDGGDSLLFDFPFSESSNFPYTQIDAGVTNLFYWNNIMHDVWYQYGFDEAAGNFQVNNYGNGGQGGDPVRAEALDGAGSNNANFATDVDGSSSRMQMFIWGGDPPGSAGNTTITVTSPDTVAGEYNFAPAAFGGSFSSTPLVGQVILVDDGVGLTSDACQNIVNGSEMQGKIALIDRNLCEFGAKILKAENEGAIAVIMCNNVGGGPVTMAPGAVGDQVTIPSGMISLANCNLLKTFLNDTLLVEIGGGDFTIPNPGPSARDGDLDNGVIAHEYTHGISGRLTGGPNSGFGCLTNEEQEGEGWSDWFALVMNTTAEMTADQGRGIATYAVNQPTTGGGIRRFRYSRSMNVNPQTYGDFNGSQEVHDVGELWTDMIWDMYWNLIDLHGFDSDFYHGTGGNNIAMQLVLDGLKLQPCNPTFPEARDAIIAADEADYNGDHICLIWKTFARRGLGFSATAGGNEAFDEPTFCDPTLKLAKTAPGDVDAGDIITYSLHIRSDVQSELSNIVLTDVLPAETTLVPDSNSCGGSIVDGVLTIELGNLETGFDTACSYQLQTLPDFFSFTEFEDGVDQGGGKWLRTAGIGTETWKPAAGAGTSHNGLFSWKAKDIPSPCDQYLSLKQPVVLSGANPALSFWHDYTTEESSDGGVLEISVGGGDWEDLGTRIIVNGYDGTLNNSATNPIANRPAFHGDSRGWIQTLVDLTEFAGSEVNFRWRFGCDGNTGNIGWFVDEVRVFGDFHAAINQACLSNDSIEVCASVITVLNGQLTATNEQLEDAAGFTLYPNPSTGIVHLEIAGKTNLSAILTVLSVDGRILQSRALETADSSFDLDLSKFGAGVYIVQMQSDAAIITRKVVVQ